MIPYEDLIIASIVINRNAIIDDRCAVVLPDKYYASKYYIMLLHMWVAPM